MKTTLSLAVLLSLPPTAFAQVAINLSLPAMTDQAAARRITASEKDIRLLLGEASSRNLLGRVPQVMMTLRYEAPSWSPAVPQAQRQEILSRLQLVWGAALRIEESGKTVTVAAAPHLPQAALSHRFIPPEGRVSELQNLLSGNFSQTYDGGGGKPSLPAIPASSPWGAQPLTSYAAAQPKKAAVDPWYEAAILSAAKNSGVDPAILRAVVAAKSYFRADLQAGDAYGLMGISAGIGKAYGHSKTALLEPAINLNVGADLLARLLRQFHGDIHRALAAYQLGPKAVLDSGGIPNSSNVKSFLAAYERAYRGGPIKPPVTAVKPVDKSALTQVREAAQSRVLGEAEATDGRGIRAVAAYRKLIEEIGAKIGVDPVLMEAMVMKENPWGDPTRRNEDTGATGLGQLMPSTAKGLGVTDITDPRQNLTGMAKHLKWLLDYFNGDKVLAVAAYNSGHVIVDKVDRIPRIRETMNYTNSVFGYYEDLGGAKVNVLAYMPPARAKSPKR